MGYKDVPLRRNLELKCRVSDLGALRERAAALGAIDRGLVEQHDRLFAAPLARLKVRQVVEGQGESELIAYKRTFGARGRTSEAVATLVADPERVAAALALALGEAGVVRKQRRLLVLDHTRIHLDEVDELGIFVELETSLDELGQEEALAELRRIAEPLGLATEDHIPQAYADLIRMK